MKSMERVNVRRSSWGGFALDEVLVKGFDFDEALGEGLL